MSHLFRRSADSESMAELCLDEDIYSDFLLKEIPAASKSVWIATADIKDVHVKQGRRFVPFLKTLSDLIDKGVAVRILHTKEPGERFRRDFDRYPSLIRSELFERAMCPRVHFKMILVDTKLMYIGSANLTGAGMGAKSDRRRNFEAGIRSMESVLIKPMISYYDQIFSGSHCKGCRLRKVCPDPIR